LFSKQRSHAAAHEIRTSAQQSKKKVSSLFETNLDEFYESYEKDEDK